MLTALVQGALIPSGRQLCFQAIVTGYFALHRSPLCLNFLIFISLSYCRITEDAGTESKACFQKRGGTDWVAIQEQELAVLAKDGWMFLLILSTGRKGSRVTSQEHARTSLFGSSVPSLFYSCL